VLLVGGNVGRAQSVWTVTDLGTLGGVAGNADDLNDAGHVVGGSNTAGGDERAFLWTPSGGMVDLGTLGGARSEARAINNLDQVVGNSSLAGGATHAFLWTAAGGMVDLGVLGAMPPAVASSGASDINDLGHVVGGSSTPGGSSHAFLWTPAGGMVDLGTLGGANSTAEAINDAGQVVGRSDTATGGEHAFLWTASTGMIDLGTLGGASSSAADINESGQVVGRAATAGGDEHAFLWTAANGMLDLGSLGGPGTRSQAEGINDAGAAVGLFVPDDGNDRAFHWTASGGSIQLPGLSGIESGARAINNSGRAAGYADIDTGDGHAAVWSDTPTTVVLPPVDLVSHHIAGTLVTLRWTIPSGGLAPTGFVLEGGLDPGQVLASVPTGSTDPTVTFTAPIGTFFVRIHALSGTTRSAASNEIQIHVGVAALPAAPAQLLGMVNGSTLALAWVNTYAGGAPTSLVLDVTGTAAGSIPMSLTEVASFAGVPAGTYTVSLRARNAAGIGPPSNPVTVSLPAPCSGPPLVPTRFFAYRVGSTIHVDWAPATSGPAPTGYLLHVTGAFAGDFFTTSRALSGAVGPGSYTLSVSAANACGSSASAPPRTVVVP